MKLIESIIYDAGIRLYAGGVSIASLRNQKARLLSRGQKDTWQKLRSQLDPEAKYVWFHAASLGEFEQGRPLIERFRKHHPEFKILLTFFSPSGYEVRKNYKGADLICYLPFDTMRNARRFVEMVMPVMAIFVKYEIWRNYLQVLDDKKIPTFLVSAVFRPSQRFFKRGGSVYSTWLRHFNHIFVQDEGSKSLLHSIGIDNVTVAGDTRFDRVADIRDDFKVIPELADFRRDAFCVMMAGSSWPQDEEVYMPWVNKHTDMKLVIAPHEFDVARLKALKEKCENGAVLLSEVKADPRAADGKQVLIIDCFGLLSSAYAYADIAYVGGAFGAGLHNINEAAVYGIPVIFGPKYEKFLEAQDMVTLGGGISIDSAGSFARNADRLLYIVKERQKRGRWAGEYISEKIGASDKIFTALTPYLHSLM